jgi:hypothetical protein
MDLMGRAETVNKTAKGRAVLKNDFLIFLEF